MTPLRAKFYCAGSQNRANPAFFSFSVMSPHRGGSVPVPRDAGAMLNLLRHTLLTELGVADFLRRRRDVSPNLRTRRPATSCTLHFFLAAFGRLWTPASGRGPMITPPIIGKGFPPGGVSGEGSMMMVDCAQVNLPRPIDG
jgi:hypothetical protein